MRLYIKMRTVFSFLIVLFLISTFNITPSFAQQAPQGTRLEHPRQVTSLAYSPDSANVATGCQDGKVRLWDVATGTLSRTLEHPNVDVVYDVAYSPDGTMVASASDDWKVRLWDVETGAIIRTFIGHNSEALRVTYSPDGTTLASSDKRWTLIIWNAETGTIRHSFGRSHAPEANLVYSPDSATLVSGFFRNLNVWDVETGARRHHLRGDHDLRDIAYSPNGNTLASTFLYTEFAKIWDATTGALLHFLIGHTSDVNSVAYSPDGLRLISGGDSSVRVWDVATGSPIDILQSDQNVMGVAYSPDGNMIAAGSYNKDHLVIWDANTLTRRHVLRNGIHGYTFWPVFSPDSTTLAEWGSAGGAPVVLWRFAPPPAPIVFTPSEVADQTFTIGTPVNLTLPFATGGTAPYTYTLAPLPNGLQFDPATRELHGTPLTSMDATPVTYTATDATGASASLTFTITVRDTPALTDVHIYWVNQVPGTIQRANLDGSFVQSLVTGLTIPVYLKLDVAGDKMYWTGWGTGGIQSANLDGSDLQDLITGLGNPHGLALDVAGDKIYWTDWTLGKIQRANLNGTNIEDIVTTGLIHPDDIELDVANSKMYWVDTGTVKIQRANLDGTNIEDIVTTSLIGPTALTLDLVGRKVYWPDYVTGKIQRANLNGTNIEDIVTTGLIHPDGIAVDPAGGKIYWTDHGTDKIQRANLNGTNIEDLITTGLNDPIGIALSIPQVPPDSGLRFNPNMIADRTFTVGTAVSLTLPTAIGGTPPYTYTLAPTLPAGLYFDPIANGPGHIGGTPIAVIPATPFTYTATDATGAFADLTFTIEVIEEGGADPLDINGDGRVDVLDLVWVAVSYGMRGPNLPADVNADGVINIQDLIAVAAAIDAGATLPTKIAEEVLFAAEAAAAEFEAGAGAPVMRFNTPRQVAASGITAYGNVADALADARSFVGDDVRLGKWLPLLKELLQVLAEVGAIPETTALLPNYPNPFNPETWIPYHLAQAAEVTLTIYDVRGTVVRELTLGHQPAGVYESRGRAAYWDGRNTLGESVASGLYFYTLTAGEFTATRKLLIAK